MRKYSGDDIVGFVVILKYSYMPAQRMTRKEASDYIRMWWENRECWRKAGWWRRLFAKIRNLFSKQTFCFNIITDEGPPIVSYATWCIAMDQITGMYTMEDSGPSSQERIAEAQARIAGIIEREQKRGEEWREGGEER
jgi:hypothetical protein